MIERIGPVAYKLDLPPSSSIHRIFPSSRLKKKFGDNVVPMVELPGMLEEEVIVAPQEVLQTRVISRKGWQILEVLIKWQNLSPDDATWEDSSFIVAQFPDFVHSLGQECAQGGIVTYRRTRYRNK